MHGTPPPTRTGDHRVTFAVLCVGVSAFSLLQSLVNPVLPTIQAALDTDQRTVTWLLTAYLLSASVFTPIVGRVGDKVGKERMLVAALGTLAVGSLIAALAPSIGVLIFARVVQGVGGGVLPLTFGIIRDEFPREKVAGAIGTAAALLAVGGALGLVVAGPLVAALSYHWLFWLPMVMTTLAALAAWRYVPASPVRTEGRIDLLAAFLLSAWLVCLLLPVSQGRDWGWGSPRTVGLLAAAVVLCGLWVRTEVRSDTPLIDMRMMRIPAVWTTNLVSLLFGVGMYAGFAFLPQFLQTPERAGYGFGASVTQSGLLLLPQSLATFTAGLLSGRLAARFGSKKLLVLGAALSSLAQLGLTLVHDQVWQVMAASALGGIAFGLAFAAMSNLVVDAVPMSQTGVASGMNANIRTVGGAIGGAVLGSVVTAGARADGLPVEAGYTHGFAVLAGCSLLAALVALLVPVHRPEPEDLPGEVRHPELAVVASGELVSATRGDARP
ncbi:MAG: Multidrug resistance transporter, superfamily protein [Frankiales bacterium]|nr:Multidrug resistance transporter, superfamily protein [Frankiales bacterium]